jgi:hypothetical protein
MMLPWMFAFLMYLIVPVGAVGFFGWLGLRFVRAREREALRADGSDASEVRRLQEQVEVLQTEVDAIRERQEFVERLLDRPR